MTPRLHGSGVPGRTAAAVRAASDRSLRQAISAWPDPFRARVFRFLEGRAAAPRKEPVWIRFQGWLFDEHPDNPGSRGPGRRRILRDLIFAQRCLFLAIRLQDDLFDGQAADLSCIYLADVLLMECERTLARHVGSDASFWKDYRQLVSATASGIVEVDRLQRSRTAPLKAILQGYARVGSIFKVGARAACSVLGGDAMRSFAKLSRFVDHVAMASQILDDLSDVEEDLDRGIWNYAARRLAGRKAAASRMSPARAARSIGRRLAWGDGMSLIAPDVEACLVKANSALGGLRMPEARDYLSTLRKGLLQKRQSFHRARVRDFFGTRRDARTFPRG